SYATHLVNVATGRPMVVMLLYIFASCGFQHLRSLCEKVFQKFFIIIVIIHLCHQKWNTPLIGLVFTKRHFVGFLRNGLSLHVHVDTPFPGFRERFLVCSTYGRSNMTTIAARTVRSHKGHVSSDEVHFLFTQIP